MSVVGLISTAIFVLAVLAIVVVALFKLSPFASHTDHFRDPATGKKLSDSPRLD